MAHFDVSSHRKDGSLVVVPQGELDIAAVDTVRSVMQSRDEGEDLVIDLRSLDFLDTSGIQLVVEAYRAAALDGFDLRIVRARHSVQRVFEIAGLDNVLPFEDGDGGG
jgi:anti-sigma B factor antagonist